MDVYRLDKDMGGRQWWGRREGREGSSIMAVERGGGGGPRVTIFMQMSLHICLLSLLFLHLKEGDN